MSNLWQMAGGLDFSNSGSRNSSVTPRRRSRSTVPIGTVASRILELQNLAQISTSERCLSSSVRHVETYKTGVGRQNITRHSQHGSTATKSDEQVQVHDGRSFLGPSNLRASHVKEHALVDERSKWERSAGIHAQLQPSGLDTLSQYEATSPWAYLPSSKQFKSVKNSSDQNGTESANSYISSMTPHKPALKSLSQDTSGCDDDNQRKSGQKSRQGGILEDKKGPIGLKKRHAGKSREWISAETTCTMRRQSVRDLYLSRGIEKPARLLSSEDIDLDPRPQKPEPFLESLNGISTSPLDVTRGLLSTHSMSSISTPVAVSSRNKQRILSGQRRKLRHRRPLDLHLFSSVILNTDNGTGFQGSSESQALNPNHRRLPQSISHYRKRQLHHDDTDSGYMGGVSHHDDTRHPTEPRSEIRNLGHSDDDHENNDKPLGQSCNIQSLAGAPLNKGQNSSVPEEINYAIDQRDHIAVSTTAPAAPLYSCPKGLSELPTSQAHEQLDTNMSYEQSSHYFDLQPAIFERSLTLANVLSVEYAIALKPPVTNSRELSTFLQLQNETILPLLSKRLQEHQEDLKQIDKLGKEQTSIISQPYRQYQVQTLAVGGSKETLITTIKEPIEHTSSTQYHDTKREDTKRNRELVRSVVTVLTTKQQEGDYECTFKQLPVMATASNTPLQGESHSLQTTRDEKGEIHGVGIKGITVVVHLEGKNDVLLKADLTHAQGLQQEETK